MQSTILFCPSSLSRLLHFMFDPRERTPLCTKHYASLHGLAPVLFYMQVCLHLVFDNWHSSLIWCGSGAMVTNALESPLDEDAIMELVTEIRQIRSSLDQISNTENKLRKAIQLYSLKKDVVKRCVFWASHVWCHASCQICLQVLEWPQNWVQHLVALLMTSRSAVVLIGSKMSVTPFGYPICIHPHSSGSSMICDILMSSETMKMSGSFNRFSMRKPVEGYTRQHFSSNGKKKDWELLLHIGALPVIWLQA